MKDMISLLTAGFLPDDLLLSLFSLGSLVLVLVERLPVDRLDLGSVASPDALRFLLLDVVVDSEPVVFFADCFWKINIYHFENIPSEIKILCLCNLLSCHI